MGDSSLSCLYFVVVLKFCVLLVFYTKESCSHRQRPLMWSSYVPPSELSLTLLFIDAGGVPRLQPNFGMRVEPSISLNHGHSEGDSVHTP